MELQLWITKVSEWLRVLKALQRGLRLNQWNSYALIRNGCRNVGFGSRTVKSFILTLREPERSISVWDWNSKHTRCCFPQTYIRAELEPNQKTLWNALVLWKKSEKSPVVGSDHVTDGPWERQSLNLQTHIEVVRSSIITHTQKKKKNAKKPPKTCLMRMRSL